MSFELADRLLKAARSAEPVLGRGQLLPYREALITFRARGFSYERIVEELKRHGVEVAASTVGCFCRRHCTRAEIQRVRSQLQSNTVPSSERSATETNASIATPAPRCPADCRGPRIARDDL